MIDPNGDNKNWIQVHPYFLMMIIFLIVMTFLYMIATGKDVPDTLFMPFTAIISYLFGLKTPQREA